jgi:transcriptional regulator with XRE-family HTH domain
MVLLRHLLGDALRRLRQRQGRTLREVSAAARVSLGYLSEVERGQKEASSELLAAICSALGAPLSQVFREVSDNFALAELQNEPVLAGVREPALDAPATVGMDTPEAPQAFRGAAQPIRLAPGRRGTGAVLDPVQLPPGQTAAFDDEVARRIRDVTDMVPV